MVNNFSRKADLQAIVIKKALFYRRARERGGVTILASKGDRMGLINRLRNRCAHKKGLTEEDEMARICLNKDGDRIVFVLAFTAAYNKAIDELIAQYADKDVREIRHWRAHWSTKGIEAKNVIMIEVGDWFNLPASDLKDWMEAKSAFKYEAIMRPWGR